MAFATGCLRDSEGRSYKMIFLTQKCRMYFLFYFRCEPFRHFYVEVFTAQLGKYFIKWFINHTVFVYFIKTFSSNAVSDIHFPLPCTVVTLIQLKHISWLFVFRTPAVPNPVRRSAVHGNDKKKCGMHISRIWFGVACLLAQYLFRNCRHTYLWLYSFPLSSHPARQLDRIAACIRWDISQQLQC